MQKARLLLEDLGRASDVLGVGHIEREHDHTSGGGGIRHEPLPGGWVAHARKDGPTGPRQPQHRGAADTRGRTGDEADWHPLTLTNRVIPTTALNGPLGHA